MAIKQDVEVADRAAEDFDAGPPQQELCGDKSLRWRAPDIRGVSVSRKDRDGNDEPCFIAVFVEGADVVVAFTLDRGCPRGSGPCRR